MSGKHSLNSSEPGNSLDPVQAAYKGMNKAAKAELLAQINDTTMSDDQIVGTLRALGYDIDRRHVLLFRKKLANKKVKL